MIPSPNLPSKADLRRGVYELTHGDPPDRESFGCSDEKWEGYLLGVEEALNAIEALREDS